MKITQKNLKKKSYLSDVFVKNGRIVNMRKCILKTKNFINLIDICTLQLIKTNVIFLIITRADFKKIH